MRTYVICMLHDEGKVDIVGPFQTQKKAARFGRSWQAAHGDNPCWQTVRSKNGIKLGIITPHPAAK